MSETAVAQEAHSAPVSFLSKRWIKTTGLIVAFVVVSFGLSYLVSRAVSQIHLPAAEMAWAAYIAVFLASLIASLSIVAPVPVAMAIIASAAVNFNPALVGLAAATGASLGEMSGYYAGKVGRKIIIPETALCRVKAIFCFSTVEAKVRKHGAKAIFVLALQPIFPFDVGGIVAGAAGMRIRSFLPALWLGRVPKFMIVAYLGASFLGRVHIPFLSITPPG